MRTASHVFFVQPGQSNKRDPAARPLLSQPSSCDLDHFIAIYDRYSWRQTALLKAGRPFSVL